MGPLGPVHVCRVPIDRPGGPCPICQAWRDDEFARAAAMGVEPDHLNLISEANDELRKPA